MNGGELRTSLDVWLVRVAESVGEVVDLHRSVLDEEERDRAERFRRPDDRHRFVAAHTALRTIVGRELGLAPHHVRFGRDACPLCDEPHGRPRVADRYDVELSLSSTPGLVAVALGPVAVGIDVESVTRRVTLTDLAESLHRQERAELFDLADDARRDAALRGWVRKEAYLKGLGVGLGVDPAGVCVGLGTTTELEAPVVDEGPNGWSIADLPTPAGHIAAVAWDGDVDLPLTVRMVSMDDVTPALI